MHDFQEELEDGRGLNNFVGEVDRGCAVAGKGGSVDKHLTGTSDMSKDSSEVTHLAANRRKEGRR